MSGHSANKTPGLESGMVVRMLPINTVDLPAWKRYYVWLFEQRRVEVMEPFSAPRPSGGTYIIPKGFQFDGGSVPRWLLVLVVLINIILPMSGWLGNVTLGLVLVGLLIERFGLMLVAFAAHDFSVKYGMLVTGSGYVDVVPDVRSANETMRRVNYATNNMKVLGWVAHFAVVMGAWIAWRRYRKGLLTPDVSWKELDYGRPIIEQDW